MKNQIKIAFAHNENGHTDKGLSTGITQYVRNTGRIQLIPWPDNSMESLAFLKKLGCQGAIASVPTYAKAKELTSTGMPVIAYATLQDMHEIPYISTNSREVAQLAFDYLSEKQFEHFGFFGMTDVRWTYERLSQFSDIVAKAGKTLHTFEGDSIHVTNDLLSFAKLWTDTTMKRSQQELINWLKGLPKPAAILASCDIQGCHLSYTTQECGLSVPDDIAILGIDNNEAMCNICIPYLSSIDLNLNKAGYEAAALLEQIITGKETMSGQRINIHPKQVKERISTDIFAIDDPDVVKALKYVRAHNSEPMQVDDVAKHVNISKRSLQMKFHQTLNTSIHNKIIHAHFLVARNLLLETDLSIDAIALRSGFHYSSNMRRTFLDITGMLPHKYRQQHRPAHNSAKTDTE